MTSLYSCRHAGDQYRITKLTSDLEVESSYLCSHTECQCPGFERRGRCRHLEMLPKFISREAIDTGWLLDFDRGGWVDNRSPEELDPPIEIRNEITNDVEIITPQDLVDYPKGYGDNAKVVTSVPASPPTLYPIASQSHRRYR